MIGRRSRHCVPNKWESFLSHTPKSLLNEVHWHLIVPWKQHGADITYNGETIMAVHNMTRLESWWFKRKIDKGVESAHPVEAGRY